MSRVNFVYFGGEPIGVPVLEELLACGLKPGLVVCNPDRPAGRGRRLTPPPVKTLAEQHNIPVYQPERIKTPDDIPALLSPRVPLGKSEGDEIIEEWDLFVVVAYNKIMPEWLIELPKYQTINVHPSLLPLRRGPNPIRSAIVEDDRASIGVSIMLMDKEMDHGPILAQKPLQIADENWPLDGRALDDALAYLGGAMLADMIPKWINQELNPTEQAHEQATYTTKVTKEDGRLEIDPHNLPTGSAAWSILHIICGLAGWPGTYFEYNDVRIKILDADVINDQLQLKTIVPAGKVPQSFEVWRNNQPSAS